jgi:uridine phosphorylase
MAILNSELILNPDGSVYHLNLRPQDIAPTVITVGDPDRVANVSQYFDKILIKRQHREFVTHAGELNGKRLMVISTGIGTDNIDIVLNELDALANVDFETRAVKEQLTSLDIIRIGTSGVIGNDIELDTFLVSKYAVGLDALMHFYKDFSALEPQGLRTALEPHLDANLNFYCTKASPKWHNAIDERVFKSGITLTCNGFYAPQLRNIRLLATHNSLFENLDGFTFENLTVSNMEMETAGIYGLATMLGHHAVSFNALLANRRTGQFSKQPQQTVKNLIETVLDMLTNSN